MKKLILLFTFLVGLFSVHGKVEIDSARLDAFMEGLIASKLTDNNIAGATACIVKDGEVILLEGYGYRDVEEKLPVNPQETMFRIASISKMFTWVAVMQMVEQGKLDLDRDINYYLEDFEIPDTFEEPITMTHLMSHTPGFEDIVLGLFAEDLAGEPLNELLKVQLPERVRPPGIHASYSNHGTALAAHIVEIVSGMEWNDYVEEYIIEPLDMHNTTFRQPLPEEMIDKLSKGYRFANGEMIEKPFEYVPLSPAGGATTTAEDMANFMRMFLQHGKFEDNTILDPATYDKMLEPVMYHAPMVNPCLYGFMDMSRKCQKIIGHGGDTFWFHSLMALMPEHNIGFFISFNSELGGGLYMDVLDIFIKHFFIKDQKLTEPAEFEKKYLKNFTGKYTPNRHPHSDYTKILSLMNQTEISVKDEMLKTEIMGDVNYWLPVDSLIFREKHSCKILAFEQDDRGNITHAFKGSWPIMAFSRVPFYESQSLNVAVLLIAIIFSLVTLLFWPIVFFARRNYKPLRKTPKALPFNVKFTAWVAAIILLCFYIFLSFSIGDPDKVVFSAPPGSGMGFVLLLPFIFIILTAIMLYNNYKILAIKEFRLRSRLYYIIISIINIIAIFQMYYWNFIGFNYY